MIRSFLVITLIGASQVCTAQKPATLASPLSQPSAEYADSFTFRQISDEIMLHGKCYESLRVLCKSIGNRISGSPQAAKAVAWGEGAMKETGADRVWLQAVDVPHWVRGKEELKLKYGKNRTFKTVPMLSWAAVKVQGVNYWMPKF